MITSMKRIVFICGILSMALIGYAQDGYRPMLKLGRTWNVKSVFVLTVDNERNKRQFKDMNEAYEHAITEELTYKVVEETKMVDRTCFRIALSVNAHDQSGVPYDESAEKVSWLTIPQEENLYMYEEDRQVFLYDSSEKQDWVLEFDFRVPTSKEVQTIYVNNDNYLRYMIQSDLCWVEGVGSNKFGPRSGLNMLGTSSVYALEDKLLSVYDNNKCIFKYEDFSGGATNIVKAMKLCEPNTGIFDLQGRRLIQKPKKGVYIQEGKKRVVK